MSTAYYEARTFLGLSVSRCWTYISVWHRHDTHTYNCIESCYFLNLLLVSACQCLYHVWCLCMYSCFIDGILCLISHCTILGFCNLYSQELLQFAKVICLKVWEMFLCYLRYVMMVGTCYCLNHVIVESLYISFSHIFSFMTGLFYSFSTLFLNMCYV